MSKIQSRSFSFDPRQHPTTHTNNQQSQHSRSSTKKPLSLQKTIHQTKLPLLKINQVLKKIGANDSKYINTYVPSDQQIGAFRKSKWKQLKDQYTVRKGIKQPFEYQLDEIVLDCWEYGENFGRKTVWKRYKQNFDQLTFDTLRVVHRKRI